MPKTIFEENNEGVFADDIGVAQVDDFIEEEEEKEAEEEEEEEAEEEEEEEVVFDILISEIRGLGEELESLNNSTNDIIQLLGELRDFGKTLLAIIAKPAVAKPKARAPRPAKKKVLPKAKPRAVVSRPAKKKVQGKPGRPGKEPPKISVRRASR
jgi:hypothetical protein